MQIKHLLFLCQIIKMSMVSSVLRTGLFKGKVAIVTGGATGIGNAISKELLYLVLISLNFIKFFGCNVVIASRNQERLQKAEEDLRKLFPSNGKPKVTAFQCNIRKEDEVKTLVKRTLDTYEKIDFLINNGGGQFMSPVADMSLKGWNAVVETNLTGTFLMCQEVFKSYMRDNGGVIVNIILDMLKGRPMMGHSGAARAGVENLTKTMAVEWAQHGIRVNAVAPGSVYSETAAANYPDPDVFKKAVSMIPANRVGTVEEISGMVCFLCSPAANFISGASIYIDGAQVLYGQNYWQVPEHNKMPTYKWEDDLPNKSKL